MLKEDYGRLQAEKQQQKHPLKMKIATTIIPIMKFRLKSSKLFLSFLFSKLPYFLK